MSKMVKRGEKLRDDLEKFWLDARAAGEHDIADVAKRAVREFQHPSFTGRANEVK